MKFSELSETAKQAARDHCAAKNSHVPDEWWDCVYEDAINVSKLMGIEISERHHSSKPNIYWSGFSSQGDGASFEGRYTAPAAGAVEKVTEHCGGQDADLIRIATELTALNVGRRLRGANEPLRAIITASGRYSHSGTMDLSFSEFLDDDDCPTVAEEDTLLRLMRAFADWVYKQLEAEYDYHMSDEVIDDHLACEDFDEFGSVI